jgi:uncharacterized membrane protein
MTTLFKKILLIFFIICIIFNLFFYDIINYNKNEEGFTNKNNGKLIDFDFEYAYKKLNKMSKYLQKALLS